MMKRRFLFLLLMLATMSATLSAYDFEVDAIYYKINKDSVSVSVTSKNSSNSGAYIGHVSVPAEVIYNDMVYPVTRIDGSAFEKCSAMTDIDLPNTIKEIGGQAFQGCSALTHIDIPDSVTFIGGQAFQGCRSLTEIFIPASVQTIESQTFKYCYGLTSIVVDENNILRIFRHQAGDHLRCCFRRAHNGRIFAGGPGRRSYFGESQPVQADHPHGRVHIQSPPHRVHKPVISIYRSGSGQDHCC